MTSCSVGEPAITLASSTQASGPTQRAVGLGDVVDRASDSGWHAGGGSVRAPRPRRGHRSGKVVGVAIDAPIVVAHAGEGSRLCVDRGLVDPRVGRTGELKRVVERRLVV